MHVKRLNGREFKYYINEKGCHIPLLKPSNKSGYVQAQFGGRRGRKLMLHRVAYVDYYGIPVTGGIVMHNCDNPACFNPLHLSLGTQKDNMVDKCIKGRAKGINRGEMNGRATVTAEIARNIYTTEGTYKQLAEKFMVTPKVVENIKRGHTWRWATNGLVKPPVKRGRPAK